MKHIFFVISMMISVGVSCTSSNHLQVCDLRCENLTNPLGIDVTAPHLSWKINGFQQKSYQILVATDALLLEEGKADLWNSGKVESPASVMVPYKGKELQSRSYAYWKVGVWDEKKQQPVWSDISTFYVGLLTSDDW
jgi:alpha-L-rhamnosidase